MLCFQFEISNLNSFHRQKITRHLNTVNMFRRKRHLQPRHELPKGSSLFFIHGCIIKKDIQVFFFLRFLFVSVNISIYNLDAFRILSSIIYKTLKSEKENKQKTLFWENFFHFQFFRIFSNSFILNLNRYFWTVINTFEVTILFR